MVPFARLRHAFDQKRLPMARDVHLHTFWHTQATWPPGAAVRLRQCRLQAGVLSVIYPPRDQKTLAFHDKTQGSPD
jgi:hypothetical protein